MNYLTSYNSYNEHVQVNKIIEYIDYSINESIDIKSIWSNVLEKIKNLSDSAKRKVIKYAIGSLLVFNTVTNVVQIVNNSKADSETKQVAIEEIQEKVTDFKMAKNLILSEEGRRHIKNEEECKLEAYTIGDGMITVGWGHAQKISDSNYKVGQKITIQEAEKLLSEDLTQAANGVRRMFSDWEKEGVTVPITQSMFDALVSLAFNSGVSGLRNSKVAESLKKSDYKETGENIRKFRINKKFPGLASRREKESEMFLSSFVDLSL